MVQGKGILLVGEPMGLYMAQQEGNLDEVSSFSLAIAGAELNVAIGASRLGHKVGYLTKLGNDFHGKLIVRRLHECGISTELIQFSDSRPTGIMFKSLTPGKDPEIFYLRGGSAASTLSSEDVNGLDFSEYGLLHMTGIMPALSKSTREASRLLVEKAKRHGMFFSFDPNLRPQLWPNKKVMITFMNEVASKADLFLPGLSEARLLMGEKRAAPEEVARYYKDRGAKAVVVKCGEKGAYYVSDDACGWGETYPVEQVVDTVGAGDGFAAGILTALCEGLPLFDAVSRGNAIGGLQIQARGDNEGLPTCEQLEAYVSQRSHE